MLKKGWDIFVGWSFTPWGLTTWSAVGGGIMLRLTYLTTQLQQYAPVSYGVAAIFGIIASVVLLRLLLSIWLAISQRLATKKPTFLEYKIENGRINLVSKSNIYKEPSCEFQDNMVVKQNHPIGQNREQKRQIEATHTGPAQTVTKLPSSASILVHFDKPIVPADFHVRIEQIVGNCPTREASSIDERWSHIVLGKITDNCSFRIRFN